jgi:hypothetical protein
MVVCAREDRSKATKTLSTFTLYFHDGTPHGLRRYVRACLQHLDKKTHTHQCHETLHIRPHKRGYLMVVCCRNHQWVWCERCCDCGLGSTGCMMPAHWMQRDAFDTGKRNHMQQHDEGANKRFKIREQQRKRTLSANTLVAEKGFACFSAIDASQSVKSMADVPPLPPADKPTSELAFENSASELAPGDQGRAKPSILESLHEVMSPLPLVDAHSNAAAGYVAELEQDVSSVADVSLQHPSRAPARAKVAGSDAHPRAVRILEQCKHVDRKHNHEKCEEDDALYAISRELVRGRVISYADTSLTPQPKTSLSYIMSTAESLGVERSSEMHIYEYTPTTMHMRTSSGD